MAAPRTTSHRLLPDVLAIIAAPVAYLGGGLLVGLVIDDAVTATVVTSLVLSIVLLFWRYRSLRPTDRHLSSRRPPALCLLGLLGLLVPVAWLTAAVASSLIRSVFDSDNFNRSTAALADANPWMLLALILAIAPVTEEILLRGTVYPLLRRHARVLASALISAVIFAYLHGNLVQLPTGLILGLVLALVYEVTGSLRWCIGTHLAYNALAFLVPTTLAPLIASTTGLNYAVLFTGLGVVTCGLYALYVRTTSFTDHLTGQLTNTGSPDQPTDGGR